MNHTKYARAYLPTINTTVEALADGLTETLRPGQWIQLFGTDGPRGQYLGRTGKGDAFVIRWQRNARWTGTKQENADTRELRAYAKRHGSL